MLNSAILRAPVLKWMSYFLVLLGLGFRIAPLFNVGNRVFRQFPTEDGYLMLTIARNIAAGNGMSTAMGTIPTNGTQPLFTLVQSGVFWLVDNDRLRGVFVTQLIEIATALMTAVFLRRLILRSLDRSRPHREEVALLGGSLWFASGIMMPHTMNCLETGLTMMLMTLSLNFWIPFSLNRGKRTLADAVKLGTVLGLTFLARIDAVFTIATLTGLHALAPWNAEQRNRRLVESTVMGATSVLVGSPWLIFNYLSLGSIMPISGVAQSHDAVFGENLREIPFKLFENGTLLFPIPGFLEGTTVGLIAGILASSAYVVLCVSLWRRASPREKQALAPGVMLISLLVAYYGFFFGADYFVGRYLAPVSLWGGMVSALVISFCAVNLRKRLGSSAVLGLVAAPIVLLVVGLNFRWYSGGTQHQHSQVVHWVETNVPEEVWVGAPQTGTLGFFHDRTVNLDGKVNPDALEARLEGRTNEYLLESRHGPNQSRIEYIVDWEGVGEWIKLAPFDKNFELLIHDKSQNLGALGRIGRPASIKQEASL